MRQPILTTAFVATFATFTHCSANGQENPCGRVCYPDFPCPVTVISGRQTLTSPLCAGDLRLEDGAVLLIPRSNAAQVIYADRDLRVNGTARIMFEPENKRQLPIPVTSAGGQTYARGPTTDGSGNASNGADGGNGTDGADGSLGSRGDDAPHLRIVVRADIKVDGGLQVTLRGGDGQAGQPGGNGGKGGDGQQGGRAIPGQPFGCANGPGQGGSGGKGGAAGLGGVGGSGGDGGNIEVRLRSVITEEQLKALRVTIDNAGGSPGADGADGQPGTLGEFGYGGRGATGCSGREEERKGKPGQPGTTAAERRRASATDLRPRPGVQGKLRISALAP